MISFSMFLAMSTYNRRQPDTSIILLSVLFIMTKISYIFNHNVYKLWVKTFNQLIEYRSFWSMALTCFTLSSCQHIGSSLNGVQTSLTKKRPILRLAERPLLRWDLPVKQFSQTTILFKKIVLFGKVP
jgi:hypothetical protein